MTSKPLLPMRLRKFIGLLVMLAFLCFYALIMVAIAVSGRVPQSGFAEFLFYLVVGLLWIVPIAPLISWMQRPDQRSPNQADQTETH